MTETCTILSLDGGGIRGVIEASFLACLEKDLDRSLYDAFDMFAGTSTGGLIALHLSSNKASGQECLDLYSHENARVIMDKSIWDKMLPVENEPRYDGKGKKKILKKVFGQKKLNTVKKDVLITAYDIIQRHIVVFKSFGGSAAKNNPFLWEIADATSAAPTYFPTVKTSDTPARWLIDGGIAANDPCMCALAESIKKKFSYDNIKILSIGTGIPTREQDHPAETGKASQKWGGIGWLRHGLIDHLFAGSSSTSEYQVTQILGKNYLRVNGPLTGVDDDMDSVTCGNIKNLKELGESWYDTNKEKVKAFFS